MAESRTARVRRAILSGGHRRAGVLAAAVLVVAVALPVLASKLLVTDANDTTGVLDVHEVRLRDPDGSPPSWTVFTFKDWTPRSLWDRGYFLLNLDTLGTAEADYYVVVRAERTGLRAGMWRRRADAIDRRLFSVRVRRRGDNGVRMWVRLGRLPIGPKRNVYRWSVTTLFTGGVCRRTCVDLAPDAGMVEQPLDPASPTPSPT